MTALVFRLSGRAVHGDRVAIFFTSLGILDNASKIVAVTDSDVDFSRANFAAATTRARVAGRKTR